jgi:hypothetical protein
MTDERREPRIEVIWPVRAAGISGVGTGRTMNVSLCGALFKADVDLDHGDLVLLEIGLGDGPSIHCVAQVVRRMTLDAGHAYGVDFRYISPSDRQKLSFALMVVREPVHR